MTHEYKNNTAFLLNEARLARKIAMIDRSMMGNAILPLVVAERARKQLTQARILVTMAKQANNPYRGFRLYEARQSGYRVRHFQMFQCPRCYAQKASSYGRTCDTCGYRGDWIQPNETEPYKAMRFPS